MARGVAHFPLIRSDVRSGESTPFVTKVSTILSMKNVTKDGIREEEADRLGALLVERLVRELGEHRAKTLLGPLAELAVREDVEVVAADSLDHALAAFAWVHPER